MEGLLAVDPRLVEQYKANEALMGYFYCQTSFFA